MKKASSSLDVNDKEMEVSEELKIPDPPESHIVYLTGIGKLVAEIFPNENKNSIKI